MSSPPNSSIEPDEVIVTVAAPGRKREKRQAWFFGARSTFPVLVAAFNEYEPAYARLIGEHDAQASPFVVRVVLVPEPSNRHDPDAVMIQADGGHKLGYLYHTQAVAWQPVIDELMRWFDIFIACSAAVSGPPRGRSLHINLQLEDLLAEQARRLALQRSRES